MKRRFKMYILLDLNRTRIDQTIGTENMRNIGYNNIILSNNDLARAVLYICQLNALRIDIITKTCVENNYTTYLYVAVLY